MLLTFSFHLIPNTISECFIKFKAQPIGIQTAEFSDKFHLQMHLDCNILI